MADIDVLLPVRRSNIVWLKETLKSLESQRNVEVKLVAVVHPDDKQAKLLIQNSQISNLIVDAPREGNLSDALNSGLEHCAAEYTARIDQDDIAEPNRFSVQIAALSKNLDCLVVGSNATLINEEGQKIGLRVLPTSSELILERMRWKSAVIHPSVTYRTNAIQAIGGYSSQAANVEDYELWLRVLQFGNIMSVDEPLLRYRIHASQMTKTHSIARNASDAVLRARIDLAISLGQSVSAAKVRHSIWAVRQFSRGLL